MFTRAIYDLNIIGRIRKRFESSCRWVVIYVNNTEDKKALFFVKSSPLIFSGDLRLSKHNNNTECTSALFTWKNKVIFSHSTRLIDRTTGSWCTVCNKLAFTMNTCVKKKKKYRCIVTDGRYCFFYSTYI